MGRGMAIPANNGHAGPRCAKLWAHDVNNTAVIALPAMGFNTELFGIGEQEFNLLSCLLSDIGAGTVRIDKRGC